jgi:hypothetical protein
MFPEPCEVKARRVAIKRCHGPAEGPAPRPRDAPSPNRGVAPGGHVLRKAEAKSGRRRVRSVPWHRCDRNLESGGPGDQTATGLSQMRGNRARSCGAAPSGKGKAIGARRSISAFLPQQRNERPRAVSASGVPWRRARLGPDDHLVVTVAGDAGSFPFGVARHAE